MIVLKRGKDEIPLDLEINRINDPVYSIKDKEFRLQEGDQIVNKFNNIPDINIDALNGIKGGQKVDYDELRLLCIQLHNMVTEGIVTQTFKLGRTYIDAETFSQLDDDGKIKWVKEYANKNNHSTLLTYIKKEMMEEAISTFESTLSTTKYLYK